MSKIIEAQIETGQPYMLYKDAVNKNQIKKILELLNHQIYVQKLLNIQIKIKQLFVI